MTQPIFDLVEGEEYSRVLDITGRFGGSGRSGIAPSRRYPAVFIFTGEAGEEFGYRDFWDTAKQVFTYTGEGQKGHMAYTKGNKAIRDHVEDGRTLHLFKKISRKGGLYRYEGEMQCAGSQEVDGFDKNGNPRELIQFQLVRVNALPDATVSTPSTKESKLSFEAMRAKAYAAVKPPNKQAKDAKRALYERSKDVALYALERAKGCCENCNQPAPFKRSSGHPYLEVHHVDRVSDGGLDAPHKVAALCPTCHRWIHHGSDGKEINLTVSQKIRELELSLGKI